MTTADIEKAKSDKDFETRDVRPHYIVYGAIGLFASAALSAAIVAALFVLFTARQATVHPTLQETTSLPKPGPRLEVSPREDGAAIITASKQELEGYAWTDQSAGRARIPIERAMAITATQGWPDDHAAGGTP